MMTPPTTPKGSSGSSTSGTISATPRSASSAIVKFSATSPWTASITPLGTPIRKRPARASGPGMRNPRGTEDASSGCRPAIAASTSAQSSALRAIGPSLSMVHVSAIAPWRLTRPYVGRRPVMPQYAAGVRIDPEVSEPMANGTSPAATADPGPEDDPPLQYSTLHGVFPGPVKEAFARLYPMPPASSALASFATSTATAPPSPAATVASSSKLCDRSEEHTSELQSRPHLVCRLLLEKKELRQRMARPRIARLDAMHS